MQLRLGDALGRGRSEQRRVLTEVERHTARTAAERTGADPDDLAGGAQLIEPGLRVGADASWQDVALPDLRGQRKSLEGDQRLAQAVDARAGGRMPVDALPAGVEARQRALVGGLDLLAQRRKRGPPQAPQDLLVAPLALVTAGAQLAADDLAVVLERFEHRGDIDRQPRAQLGGLERPVRAREPAHEALERVGDLLEEHLGQAAGRHGTQRIAIQAGVLGGDPALLAADTQDDRPPRGLELGKPFEGQRSRRGALGQFGLGQVTDPAQHVVKRVGGLRARAFGASLQVGLDLIQGDRVDQVAQLLEPEQLAQQIAVE